MWQSPMPVRSASDRSRCHMPGHGTPFRAKLGISMQRGTAIVLTLLFGWLLVLPAFGGSGLTVPLCCRKEGKHHCQMRAAGGSDSGPAFSAISEKCPCYPHATFASQARLFTPCTARAVHAALILHHAVSRQAGANYRISYDRSRQKRGPPLPILL